MLLSKKELMDIAEPRENDEVHQSRLLNPKNSKYNYKVLLKKNNFKVKPNVNFVIVSTNEDRIPIYRFRFSWNWLLNLFNEAKSDYINIFINDKVCKLYIPGEQLRYISEILEDEYLY